MSLSLQPLDKQASVSGQLSPDDMKDIAAQGFGAVVNNRPDREAMFGQPRTADLKQAAEAAGLLFVDLPFPGPNVTAEQVRALADILDKRDRRVVAFCKSGMRSALIWAAAEMSAGRSLDEVLSAARNAGQNLDPVGERIAALAVAARQLQERG
jgi:uncharacterized protein (TIGR01244 family)